MPALDKRGRAFYGMEKRKAAGKKLPDVCPDVRLRANFVHSGAKKRGKSPGIVENIH